MITIEEIINNIKTHIREQRLIRVPDWKAYVHTYLEALVDTKVINNTTAEYIYNEFTH